MNQNLQTAPTGTPNHTQQTAPSPSQPKTLHTLDGNTLMAQEFEPLRFSVEKILPHGLFILAGSPKVGKSWLALDLCQAVATGGKLWEFPAEQSNALYLALEDNYNRLQGRLAKFEAAMLDVSRLHLATTSFGIHDGLLEQIHHFLSVHVDTTLVVIDTLEHIRNGGMEKTLYSYDYQDMTKLREITNRHKVTLLLVHHTRKTSDPDPLNTISGSTGPVGAVDGVFVLEKAKRTENAGRLTIANRDTEGFCFDLKFDADKCRWSFVGNASADEDAENEDLLALLLDDFLQDEWSGTATELCKELKNIDGSFEVSYNTIKNQLVSISELCKNEFGIAIDFDRSNKKRLIFLKRIQEVAIAAEVQQDNAVTT